MTARIVQDRRTEIDLDAGERYSQASARIWRSHVVEETDRPGLGQAVALAQFDAGGVGPLVL